MPPRHAVTVDCAVFGLADQAIEILLVQRDVAPFRGRWALPGGFVLQGESLEDAARRELAEETGLRDVFLEQLYTFGDVARDPRERVVTVAYYALVCREGRDPAAGTDARSARWFPLRRAPRLAFDHDRILEVAVERLKGKVRYQPIGFELLPRSFSLSRLQHLYELLLERPLDKRNFRKKVLALDILEELDLFESGVAHRAARLYRFDPRRYRARVRDGFLFEL